MEHLVSRFVPAKPQIRLIFFRNLPIVSIEGLRPTAMSFKLPPLILHPFANSTGPAQLVDASRASLILNGVLPPENDGTERLEQRLLAGRYCELSMLFYLGKDLLRWVSQCMDFAERTPELQGEELRPESFASLLVDDTPPEVRAKLRTWGVHEYSTIFSRALGLHEVFDALPPAELLALDFTQYYHQFADHFYACGQQLFEFKRISSQDYHFDIYASGEYSRMLEQEWGAV